MSAYIFLRLILAIQYALCECLAETLRIPLLLTRNLLVSSTFPHATRETSLPRSLTSDGHQLHQRWRHPRWRSHQLEFSRACCRQAEPAVRWVASRSLRGTVDLLARIISVSLKT